MAALQSPGDRCSPGVEKGVHIIFVPPEVEAAGTGVRRLTERAEAAVAVGNVQRQPT